VLIILLQLLKAEIKKIIISRRLSITHFRSRHSKLAIDNFAFRPSWYL